MEFRRLIQWISALIHNSYLYGFTSLKIYQGPLKGICVPILNCYSCPGAVGSCPVGSMQASLASWGQRISLYVLGMVTIVGALAGRWVCGWLCPFGMFQELLAGIGSKDRQRRMPRGLSLVKYPILLATVLLPVIWIGSDGLGSAYYCRFICPAGTLESGIPLGIGRSELRALLGITFLWKLLVLAGIIAAAMVFFRPFCRTLCPLGAFYGLFNPISVWRLQREEGCTSCGMCRSICPMDIDVVDNLNSSECIRCLRCTNACPGSLLHFSAQVRIAPVEMQADDNIK